MPRRWPFLIPFSCMAAGMVLTVLGGLSCHLTTVIAVFCCLLLASFLRHTLLFSACIPLFFFVWGLYALSPWLFPETSARTIRTKASAVPITIEGVVSERPSVSSEGSRLTVQVEHIFREGGGEAATGTILLFVSNGDTQFCRGDRIRFVSPVTVPRRLGLPGEFDYSRYLAFQGISATCRVASQSEIVLIRAGAVESLQRSIDRIARRIGDSIRSAIPDENVSSVLAALLIGDQRRIPRDLADAYTRAGVNHILSISGFHIGIIAAFITVLCIWSLTRFEYPALRWDTRRTAVLIAVPVMVLYLFLTGAAPATARSVIMLLVFACALFAERERDAINTLLLSAFFLVAINPPTLFDVSFQLSFISLWGIVITMPLVMRFVKQVRSHLVQSLILFVAASVSASSVTLLPVLFIFKVASLNGVLTNFLIVPLLGYGAVLCGFIAMPFVLLFPTSASLLYWPAAAQIVISNKFIVWCNSLPVLTFHGVTGWDMLFFLLFMTCITFIKNGILLVAGGVLLPVTAVILHLSTSTAADGRLHVTMLSVGQAESLLLQLPDGSTMLVDGGGYLHDTGHDFGQRILAPALGALQVGRIDRMIATHDHPDHSGGLPFVIKNFAVGEFWSGTDVTTEIQAELERKHVPRRALVAGDVITLPGPTIVTVLSPVRSNRAMAGRDELSVNEQSLVFRLSYGNFSMIFCADAGFEAELGMIGRQHELASTVLKVGHHGSRFSTSPAFLERVHPRLAMISAGFGNRFNLPSPVTVDALAAKGIPLYRTDHDGTIELVTDGIVWSVSTRYKPE